MRHALLPLFLAMPAQAQSVADFGGTGCAMSQDGDEYRITCQNVETTGNALSEGVLAVGDMTVGLTISHGPGSVPDTFTITAPEGFVAIPPSLVLDEFTQGVIVLYRYLGF